ncbi:MAG: hypothetical protein PHV55_02090, partial [Candidatus Omnitrophica bacterium]|nr:hypothetical protein [Candidatus Omnitrophota bacterium]
GCCWNVWSEFGGNVFSDGYTNSIKSEKIRYAQQMLLGKAAPRQDIPCSVCDIYLKMKEKGNYLSLKELYPSLSLRNRLSGLVRQVPGLRWIGQLYKCVKVVLYCSGKN